MMRVLKVLDQALEPKTFLVGEGVTLADIAVVAAVLLPFKYVRMWSCKHSCRFSERSTAMSAFHYSFLGIGAIRQNSLD